jgi:hypothetical protein
MDVKSAFLNDVIWEDVFVRLPPGFKNHKYPDRVYMLSKSLYVIESVDKTIFTLKHGNDFLLVQIYVDDIIFGGSSYTLVSNFQEMIENEFQVSMMRELTFFLGIQVKQMKQGTFIHQAKYTKDLIKKFNMDELKPVSTLMSTTTSLDPYKNG